MQKYLQGIEDVQPVRSISKVSNSSSEKQPDHLSRQKKYSKLVSAVYKKPNQGELSPQILKIAKRRL
jgi:hypothetical protein